MNTTRETLGSRLGFLLLAAGCAIGLGNIWRFPFIVGQHGGAVFVLLYLGFLVLLGLPVMIMELAIGRASRRTLYGAAKVLVKSQRFPWTLPAGILFMGSAILMSYYTTVTGWLIAYFIYYADGTLAGLRDPAAVGAAFGGLLASPWRNAGFMLSVVVFGSVLCGAGLRRGVERSTKLMMAGLFSLLLILCVRAMLLPGAEAGLRFYLTPNLSNLTAEAIPAALGQAFFTLSLGIGSIAVFGSYTDKKNTLVRESAIIIGLDTLVALLAGCVIFPACSSSNVAVDSGPGLIFISLPNVFNGMAGGRWWGMLFFFFLSMAALTTVVAVFENLIAFMIDEWHFSRRQAALVNGVALALLSLPCALGFNLWSGIQPLGAGSTILDFEDYLVSDNLLICGGIYLAVFCTSRLGWGWTNFLTEANTGRGARLPSGLYGYLKWGVPFLVGLLFAFGFYNRWLR